MNKLLSVLLCLLLLIPGCSQAEEPLLIVATNFPCYDLCREVAGETAQIEMLLPPGTEIHSYEPTPRDLIMIQNADLFVYVGGESDTWAKELLESLGGLAPEAFILMDHVSVREEEYSDGMAQGEHAHEHHEDEEGHEEEHDHEEEAEMDEHVWTSPVNMMALSMSLAEKLSRISPSQAALFGANSDRFVEELASLDSQFREIVENGIRKTIIFGDRFPFLYFVEEYGLEYDAAFPGCSEDSEPSVRTVVSLVDRVRDEEIPVVFYIEYSSCRTADILCEETGAQKLLFHSCHNISAQELEEGASYLSLMEKNVQALQTALN